jgi:dTDP-4-amino-4,6-dideoxygalactose transaminase
MPGPGLDLVGEEEIAEVVEVLQSGFLSRYGPNDDPAFKAKVARLEEQVAQRAGVHHALAVSSGTAALYVALTGLGIGPGDEVIVPGFTFIASISSTVYARARPVLAEIDDSFNLDPTDVEKKITPRTKAILAVHMLGSPARITELKAIADRHGLALVEDCAQAFGGTYRGGWLGSLGRVGTYSFNDHKTITCGDGGMVITDDENLYGRCFAIHDQGHSPYRLGVEVGERPFLGLNFRMVEMQAAVLLAQFRKLDQIVEHLRANRDIVRDAIADLPGIGFRRSPDPEGDLATHLVVTFPTEEVARKVAGELGSITLSESGWHVYTHMEHLLNRRTVTDQGCPFNCECYGEGETSYWRGMLPQTDALLGRSMSFAIGVIDPNLAPWGLRMRDGADVARERAARFREVAARYLA